MILERLLTWTWKHVDHKAQNMNLSENNHYQKKNIAQQAALNIHFGYSLKETEKFIQTPTSGNGTEMQKHFIKTLQQNKSIEILKHL